ncbi:MULTISPECIES: 3-deoxy-D-manno-octulosonic acid transferase [unclassified Imperialibacter]|uniref:3-deoxy-D-manno-octulosonic acid transferase n=1 Tax=unclassified Imperialibacter TaxID=2629706 RepID=UPI00125BD05E|nr:MULTISPECIES: glycosyltransferase N-terminal domain-containing protein [unclassified Imperialibacter]CAD5266870.1 3-deoxy-D-manno-octulosonic acid transferase [Imperialibacter sp. 75]CAD5297144.1 3-deoxy-D-manno-octulosonic acid transferase [Imperialibacter sp. 89]VVT27220.1 3-deoxy-D-manno-octulosonic-acid transferase [Imperialibacter sp. EC-SDR9]
MIYFLYKAGAWIYFALIRIVAVVNPKAALFYKGRKNLFRNLEDNLPSSSEPLVWFHAASLGEFEQGRPVIEELKRRLPNVRILLTFFSPSGFEVRKGYAMVDYICYLPIESAENVKRFYDLTNPKLAVFVKYEFWKEYIDQAHSRNIPLLSISSIFWEAQIYFKSYGKFLKESLYYFDHFFVQNETSKRLLESINIDRITVAGDTRFDRVTTIRQQAKDIEIARVFKDDELVIVLGSVWESDMKVLFPALNALGKKVKVIIAPHQIEPGFLTKIEMKFNHSSVRFSKATAENAANYRLLLIDNIGMLSSLYGYGEIAFVGGGFRGGLHNTLEPAAFGIPVLWGDSETNARFAEIAGLVDSGGGLPIGSSTDAAKVLADLVENAETRKAKGKAAGDYVQSKTGATDTIVEYLTKQLK